MDCGEDLLRNNSPSKWPSFLEMFMKLRRVQAESCYLVFTLDSLHTLYPGISQVGEGLHRELHVLQQAQDWRGAEGWKVAC